MNPKDFRQSALREMPKETLSRHRDEAVRQFVEWGMTSQTDVASCVELAGRLQGAFSGANEAQMRAGSEMRGERINADVMRRSDRLAAFLLPWVEYIREGLFDKTAVPFRTIEAAIRWLDKTSREHPAPKISDEKEDELEEEIRKQIAAYERRTGHRMRFTIKESELTLYRAGENFPEVLKWPAPAGSPLGILRREIEDMERLSFFRPDVLLVYILVGVKPLLPDADVHADFPMIERWGRPSPFPLNRPLDPDYSDALQWRVSVRFHSRDVPPPRVQELYSYVRLVLDGGKERGYRMTGKQQKLLSIVDGLGGEPETDKTAFWEKVMERWNASVSPRERHDTWRSPMMAYRRLRKKIGKGRTAAAPSPSTK